MFNKILPLKKLRYFSTFKAPTPSHPIVTRKSKEWSHPNQMPEEDHHELPMYPETYTLYGPPRGKPHSLAPVRINLEAGKEYHWCACGMSKSQPLCDYTHRRLRERSVYKTTPLWRPLKFKVESTGDYWLCDCKQTRNAPYCDGSHRTCEMEIKEYV